LLGIGLFLVGMIELLEGMFEHFETEVEYYHGFLLFGFVTGPVAYSCRSECSFRPPGVRRPRGFCLPMLSADGAGYRSR
jgi:hypothetical protein